MGRQKHYISKNQGFTLMELLITLGIIAVLSLTAFIFYPKVRDSGMANQNNKDLQTILAQIPVVFPYGSLGNLGQSLNITLINTKIVPSDMILNGQIVDAAHNSITIYVANKSNLLEIQYTKMSTALCFKLASSFQNRSYLLDINGVSLPASYNLSQAQNFVMTRCNSTNLNSLIFVFQI